jgi:NSS family neurotransmitter:Na+ symporter
MKVPASHDARWLNTRFVVASAAVSAMGLGNICRFPYLVSRHGGGAFVLVYLLALVALALPILMAELMVGRRGRVAPAECFGTVARDEGHSWRWGATGVIASGAGLMVLAAYAQAAGSAASLLVRAGRHPGIGFELGWQGTFLGLASLISAHGLQWGLRPLYARLLPVTLLLLAGILAYSASTTAELNRALFLVLQPDFTRLTWWGVLDAARLALLTVGVGLGAAVSYGAAISESTSILRTSLLAALSTTALVLMGAIAALSIAPSAALSGFLLLAGLGGAVAILHPLIEHVSGWTGLTRIYSGLLVGAIAWAIAAALEIAEGSPSIDWLDAVGVNLLMPGAALCGVLFVGWVMSRRSSRMGLAMRPPGLFVLWRWLIRFPLPILLGGMLLLGMVEIVS